MEIALIAIFLLGYALIALEHNLHIDKAATAILTGATSWFLIFGLPLFTHGSIPTALEEGLVHHLSEAAAILFFLLGAMTIVEVIDSYDGFRFLLRLMRVHHVGTFLGILVTLSFFISAVIDNLTTTLLMVSLLQKATLPEQRNVRLLGASLVVLAANSGGAWSPLGDVTTTMLWIKGCITETGIIKKTFIPSVVSVVVPFLIMVRYFRGASLRVREALQEVQEELPARVSLTVFIVGIGGILAVPILKLIFHVPPFLAMLLAMSVVWITTELFYRRLKNRVSEPMRLKVASALEKIDTPSLLFFLGILLAVGALGQVGLLRHAAQALNEGIGDLDIVVFLMGVLSSVVDNVPLVAAAIEMYPLSEFPTDHRLWEFMAYAAGVGGNILIIGSAAGVIAMGMEKIEFFWYLKRVAWIAFLGYASGALAYIILA
ncbi:MAG: sodium:proton antiporter NhaD [Bacteroidia bacterium]|nr:sodium:proton antiporter NhaD [Bacteroidia bacterium]MCX7651578.1 sodium:proton antiporter NhaD [Bacteroidia bacterium]MDW8417246.1 sodium:proton antiporter NhaD [Bacteroidia bacterium]